MDIKKKSFVVAALRRASYRWPGRFNALKASKAGRNMYFCSHCPEGVVHGKKDIQLDHILPIVPVSGWDGFDGFIERLFCDIDGYQVLCKEHHSIKTKGENSERKDLTKKKKRDKI